MCITNRADGGISHKKFNIFGINHITYNDNNETDGSFAIEINKLGKIGTTGTSSLKNHSYITDVFMWN